MKLGELLGAVENSTIDGWHALHFQTVHSWEVIRLSGQNYAQVKTYERLAVYKEDIDISLVLTAPIDEKFSEPWTRNFASPDAESVSIALRYRGAMVHEWIGVIVDGGKYLLPKPELILSGAYAIGQDKLPVARLLFGIYGIGGPLQSLEAALNLAGIIIV